MKTVEEFFKGVNKHKDYLNVACAFAKMHVFEALKSAVEKAEINQDNCYFEAGYCHKTHIIEESILNSYNLEDIK